MRREPSAAWTELGYGTVAARPVRRPRVARSEARKVLAGLRVALREALATVPGVGEVRRG